MINQLIETTLCHIDIEASKIYVPHEHQDMDLITILFDKMGKGNLREVWRLEFLNSNIDLLMRQEFEELFYVNTQRILVVKNDSLITYSLGNKLDVEKAIIIEKGEYNQFSIKSQLLYHLTKQTCIIESQNQENQMGSQFVLRIYDSIKLERLEEIRFSATVRTLNIQPISNTSCFMINPNSPTNKNLQFIIYNGKKPKSKIIQVKETQNELRGTVVKVLSYKDQLIFIYNSNGVNKQYLLFFGIENENEMLQELDFGEQYQIRDAQLKENIILFTCFNITLNNEFMILYDILDKNIKKLKSGEWNYMYGQNVIVQHNNESIELLLLQNKYLMMTHYIDKLDIDLSIKQQLSEF